MYIQICRHVFSMDAIGREILSMAFPAALALASDPVASLIDTAFIGRLGAVQLAAVGVSIAIFNQASRITIFPIVSITTSFVAEEDTMERMKEEEANKANLVHADTILVQDSLEKGLPSPASNNTINQPQQPPGKIPQWPNHINHDLNVIMVSIFFINFGFCFSCFFYKSLLLFFSFFDKFLLLFFYFHI